ncbi:hypothetical protein DRQ07_04945 [candidate division KSB1 bacterium]|nr:MAG: hypothetical protein DRQ07_04945 [candidate division KSB1 bacterium]
MYLRTLENKIKEKINSGKAVIIVGARQVGNTTLVRKVLENTNDLLYDPTIINLLFKSGYRANKNY